MIRCWRWCLVTLIGPPPAAPGARPRIASASSISSSVTSSGGATRTASGRTALTSSPSASARPATALARSPSRRAASSSPAPRTSTTPGSAASPAASRAPARWARPHTSSSSMTASVARAADSASGWPPKVEPWSPGPNAAATSARAQHAPTGIPLPSALAMVTMSGCEVLGLEREPVAGPAEAGLDLVGDRAARRARRTAPARPAR